jgi:hypothetical protein
MQAVPKVALDSVQNNPRPASPHVIEEFYIRGEPARALFANVESLRRRPNGDPLSAPVRDFVDAREWSVPGAYMLLWPRLSEGRVPVYIGGTRDLLDRLFGHERTGWTNAVALTGFGLTSARAFQLEHGLGKALLAADPDQRVFSKLWKSHPALELESAPYAVGRPLIILAERVLRHVGIFDLALDPARAFIP